ncbi:hypothetical protein NIES2101_38425 [Calothrix sp. HK-06]|nr:hypothetical protein NIES2101_38425 [Calothrix sp. HK-06]
MPWEDTANVLELYRQEAGAIKAAYGESNNNAIVNNLQMFLSLAFILLIPVDRARTYYELEVGKTFVYGMYKDGRFTPAYKIKDNSQATWYIHLMPENYKTGEIYGESWREMPNIEFLDGTKLYDYINKWLNAG